MAKKLLVILPGWGGSKETWNDFIKLAENDYDVLCIDLPCFGSEPCPNEVWGVEEYSSFVQKKLQKLGDKEVILLGHSFGGQIASYLVAHHPGVANQLVLSGAAIMRPRRPVYRALFGMLGEVGKMFFSLPFMKKFRDAARSFLYKIARSPDYAKTSGVQRDIFKKVVRQDVREHLPSISVPTLVVWGQKDTYTPLRYGKKAARLIKGAKLHIVRGGRHGLHIQDPANLLAIIRDFTDNHD